MFYYLSSIAIFKLTISFYIFIFNTFEYLIFITNKTVFLSPILLSSSSSSLISSLSSLIVIRQFPQRSDTPDTAQANGA